VVVGWGVAWGSRYDARLFDVGIGIRALGSEKKIALPTPVTCQPYDSLSSSQLQSWVWLDILLSGWCHTGVFFADLGTDIITICLTCAATQSQYIDNTTRHDPSPGNRPLQGRRRHSLSEVPEAGSLQLRMQGLDPRATLHVPPLANPAATQPQAEAETHH
jgi:hypothetical protein